MKNYTLEEVKKIFSYRIFCNPNEYDIFITSMFPNQISYNLNEDETFIDNLKTLFNHYQEINNNNKLNAIVKIFNSCLKNLEFIPTIKKIHKSGEPYIVTEHYEANIYVTNNIKEKIKKIKDSVLNVHHADESETKSIPIMEEAILELEK